MKKELIILCLLAYAIATPAFAEESSNTTSTATSTVATSTIPISDDDVTLQDIGMNENATSSPSNNEYVALRNKYIKSLKIRGKINDFRANNIKKLLDLRFRLWRNKMIGRLEKSDNSSSTPAQSKEAKNLNSIIDALIKQSQNLKNRAINSEFISNELEKSIVIEIDGDISKLNEFKTQIQNATSSNTINAIRIKLQTHKIDVLQIRTKKILALINIGKLEASYSKRLDKKVLEIQEKIAPISSDTFKNQLEDAKTKISQAKQSLQNLRNEINSKPLSELKTREITKELVAIAKQFGEANKILNQINSALED